MITRINDFTQEMTKNIQLIEVTIMQIYNISDAVNMFDWKVYQLNFTDGSSERIASFISTDLTEAAHTVHIYNGDIATAYIEDEVDEFSFEEYFGKKLDGPIEDVTKEYES